MSAEADPRRPNERLEALALLACAVAFFVHLFVVRSFAVDIPFVDEWDELRPGALDSGWSAAYLLGLHNEHRIATTRALALVLLRVNGWDLAAQQTLNFVVFGALLGSVAVFASRCAPALPRGALWALLLPLLSPIAHQNHAWPFQVQIHLVWLFAFASLLALFGGRTTPARALAGVLCAVLAMWSFSSGVVFGVVLAASLVASALRQPPRFGEGVPARLALAAALALVAALGLWFVGFHASAHAPVRLGPATAAFWDYWLNLVSWGFGFSTLSAALGAACLALVLTPAAGELVASRGRLLPAGWARLAATLSVLLSLGAIAAGRAAFGIPTAKASRFSEIGLLLVPLSALHWSAFLERRPRAKAVALFAVWALAAAGLADDWTLEGYERMRRLKRQGVECVTQAVRSGGPTICPTVYDLGPISAEMLDSAKRLRLSFYRSAEARTAAGR